jgi:hypothetical protein
MKGEGIKIYKYRVTLCYYVERNQLESTLLTVVIWNPFNY